MPDYETTSPTEDDPIARVIFPPACPATDAPFVEPAKKSKRALDTRARWQKIIGDEPDAKAILPEPRSVQKAISY